jgi:branched-chain amino acid transport system ATP-binding protein
MLELRNLGISFGGLKALSDVSLRVEAGLISSIIGPNGAGKTTLFNIITGLRRPSTGTITYEGKNITAMKPSRIAGLGVIRTFQKTEVFPRLCVHDCVRTGFLCDRSFSPWEVLFRSREVQSFDSHRSSKTDAILDFVGLRHHSEALASQLSYGEQRLLEIAVGLAASPRLMLLDEPASGMNVDEAERMMMLIRRLKDRGITVVLVEHNMRVVMGISDYVVVLDCGQTIAKGAPREVSEDAAVITAYLGRGWKSAEH